MPQLISIKQLFVSLQIKKEEVDKFADGKRLPQCSFTAKWSGGDQTPTTHDEEIKLIGTKTPNSITVECDSGMTDRVVLDPQCLVQCCISQ